MRFYRIGDKVVSREKVFDLVAEILEAREGGAHAGGGRARARRAAHVRELPRDRSARCVAGKRVAIIGFPVANGDEVRAVADRHAVEFCLLLSQEEREGLEAAPADRMFNLVLETLARAHRLRRRRAARVRAADGRRRADPRPRGRRDQPRAVAAAPRRGGRHGGTRRAARGDPRSDPAGVVGASASSRRPSKSAGRWQRSKRSSAQAKVKRDLPLAEMRRSLKCPYRAARKDSTIPPARVSRTSVGAAAPIPIFKGQNCRKL